MAAPLPYGSRARGSRFSRHGYTLVEVLVSSISMGVLMVGIASAVLLATQAVDDGQKSFGTIRRTTSAMDEFIRDMGCALSFQTDANGAWVLTVPDRSGDGQEETIRYTWSYVAGDPLTRELNGGTPSVVLANVRGAYAAMYPSADPNGSTSKLGWIRLSILAGEEFSTRIDAAVQTLNTPNMSGP
jgi:type II secretory pathway pseudopilin PulG